MDKKEFGLRLGQMRAKRGIVAKTMSELIGQNPAYISNIECGNAYPSLDAFFRICEYMNVTPSEFLDEGNPSPIQLQDLLGKLKRLDARQLEVIEAVVDEMIR